MAKFKETKLSAECIPNGSIDGEFKSIVIEGHPLADTSVKINLEDVCIHYDDREKFLKEIAKVVEKFQI